MDVAESERGDTQTNILPVSKRRFYGVFTLTSPSSGYVGYTSIYTFKLIPQSSRNGYSSQFHSGGNQWIGSTINTSGGDVHFGAPHNVCNTTYQRNQIGDNARVQFVDQ